MKSKDETHNRYRVAPDVRRGQRTGFRGQRHDRCSAFSTRTGRTMTKCATKYCRNDSTINVVGVPMCDACWEKSCDERAQLREHNKLEARMALNRHYAEAVMCRICEEREATDGLDVCLRCDKLQADAWAEQLEQVQEAMLK